MSDSRATPQFGDPRLRPESAEVAVSGRPKADRSRLPAVGPAPRFRFPAIQKSSLPNGLRVWTVPQTTLPIATLTLLMRRGAAMDPPGREGLAALTLDMLDEGSRGKSAIEMHEELARLGTRLDSDIGSDATMLSLTALSRVSERALSIMADMAVRPTLAAEDFDRVRQLRLHRLKQLRDVASAVADRVFVRLLYGSHPYGHTPLGNEASLSGSSIDDVRAFHRAHVRPADATLIAVGDCDHDAVLGFARSAFGDWNGAPSADQPADAPLPDVPRINVVARAGAPQSELRIGHVAVARHTPDYHAIVAANAVLGGQFTSRINLNLREDKGFTYGAYTGFDFRRLPGPFTLYGSVDTGATSRAIAESLDEIAAIRGPRPVSAAELSLAVAGLTRGYARNFETVDQIARAVMQLALYDLPDDHFSTFVPRVEAVTPDEVTRVAQQHLHPERLTTLVVGDLERIGAELAGLGLGEPRVLTTETFC
jgi:predicted Zn-dependent peptidase